MFAAGAWDKLLQSVRFFLFEIAETACLRVLTTTGLPERVLVTLDSDVPVTNTAARGAV